MSFTLPYVSLTTPEHIINEMTFRVQKMRSGMHRSIFLLYIFVLFAIGIKGLKNGKASVGCPTKCTCDNQYMRYVSCSWKGLSEIPRDIPHDVEHLSLYGNEIKSLRASDMANMTNLKILNLDRNLIDTIEESSLNKLYRLTSLSLSGNQLRQVPSNLLQNLSALQELHLDFNQIKVIPDSFFRPAKSLKKLFLNGNHLTKIGSKTFDGANLLEKLGLSFNRLQTVEEDAFREMSKMQWVRLNNNNITTIGVRTFADMTSLTRMHLDNNKLKTLPGQLLQRNTRLNILTLHKNPFLCSCNLRWLQSIFENNKIIIPSLNQVRCNEPAYFYGVPLSRLKFEEMRCMTQSWSTWGAWSICNTHCGGGLRYRERRCQKGQNTAPRFGCMGNKFQTESCNTHPCPLFQLTEWSDWRPCSKSCGYGISSRWRSCIDFFTGEESELCVETRNETRPCHIKPCRIDGAWSEWSPWSPCSRTCGMAVKRRRRSCTNPMPQHGGAQCDGGFSQSQNRICMGSPCVDNIKWTSWSEFSRCSVTCGKGERVRRRFCINDHEETVSGCRGNKTIIVECTSGPCPIDGGWSVWSVWSRCHPIQCKKVRTRNCSQPTPAHGGKYCLGRFTDHYDCHPKDCFVYSQWGTWGAWSECTKSCNGGYRTRHRKCHWSDGEILEVNSEDDSLKVSRSRAHRSRGRRQIKITCGSQRTEIEECNNVSCSSGTGTVWGSWGRWSSCQGGCNGRQLRKRTCVYPSIKDGLQYCEGHSKEERNCQSRNCQNYAKEIVLGSLPNPCNGSESPDNGFVVTEKKGNLVTAKYSCKRFYRLRGVKTMTCDPKTGWSHPVRPHCVPVCGKRSVPGYGRARILGGNEVVRGSWPWQVLIESNLLDKGGWKVRCGGSLINEEWVVTAGHCLYEKLSDDSKRLLKPSEHRLYFGVHNKELRKTDPSVQIVDVKQTIIHSQFDSYKLDNDIGLIQLKRKISFTDYIKPVCMPNKAYQKLISSPGKRGHVIGWGWTRTGTPNILQELTLPVVQKSECKKAYPDSLTENMFCAGRKKSNFDTCKGDSGGGYLFWDSRRRKWFLQGIISWGGTSCGQAGMYSVYTKVGRYTRWVKRMIRKESVRAAL